MKGIMVMIGLLTLRRGRILIGRRIMRFLLRMKAQKNIWDQVNRRSLGCIIVVGNVLLWIIWRFLGGRRRILLLNGRLIWGSLFISKLLLLLVWFGLAIVVNMMNGEYGWEGKGCSSK